VVILAGLVVTDAVAETIAGRITFPGRSMPAAVVFLRSLDTETLHQQAVRRGEVEFSIDVPPGRYWVFMRPDEPGLTDLYGAHTQYSLCRRASNAGAPSACEDHQLAEVPVNAGDEVTRVEVDDWLLSDAAAHEIDRILGQAPSAIDSAELGRPRFSEYRVARSTAPPAALDLASDPRATPLSAELQTAAMAGSNFAGRFTLLRVACGEQCERVALIDHANGAVVFPEQLAQVSETLPCRAERALEFRDDSRLLEFTRREAEFVITDSLLWDVDARSFTPLAQYRRSLERFCAGATPAQ
jgi:hypothetical protein